MLALMIHAICQQPSSWENFPFMWNTSTASAVNFEGLKPQLRMAQFVLTWCGQPMVWVSDSDGCDE